jgi:excisionase family DNA binding protein
METTRPFSTVSEVASRLRLPAAWLRREAISGRLPCIRAGRRLLLDIEAVRAALAARQAAPAEGGRR